MKFKKIILAISLLFFTAACATSQTADLSDPVNDPYEKTNRAIFEFNRVTDRAVMRPISAAYRAVVPKPGQKGISNFARNLREPWVFVNDLLQGKFGRAGKTLSRFVINTTIGIGGLFKPSEEIGIPYHSEDFGQTLATWGVGRGKYLVLPFLGPSTHRDFAGFSVDFFADPTDLALDAADEKGLQLARLSLDVLERRTSLHTTLEELYKEKDPYLFARSAYLQRRDFEIRDGKKDPDSEEDDLFDELEDDTDN